MNCFAAKNHDTTAPYTQRRLDVVTLFTFYVAKNMAASSLLLMKKKRKKAEVSDLVSLRTNQGVFQLEQRSMRSFPAFSCFDVSYLQPLLCRLFSSVVCLARNMPSSDKCRGCPTLFILVFPCRGLLSSSHRPIVSAHWPCYRHYRSPMNALKL